jgi:hypothetical protein
MYGHDFPITMKTIDGTIKYMYVRGQDVKRLKSISLAVLQQISRNLKHFIPAEGSKLDSKGNMYV